MPPTVDLTPEDDPLAAADELTATLDDPMPAAEPGWPDEAPEVTEPQVRAWLDAAGTVGNIALPGRNLGLDDAWEMTATDLDAIAPPLTRIINRSPRARAVAARSDADGLALVIGLGRYGWRNIADVIEARAEAEPPPTTLADRARTEAAAGPDLPPGMTGQVTE